MRKKGYEKRIDHRRHMRLAIEVATKQNASMHVAPVI
jgi:hypothetical protein